MEKAKNHIQEYELKSTKYITNDIEIVTNNALILFTTRTYDNSMVRLLVAEGVEGGRYLYLETNGDPVLVQDNNLEECSIDLGMTPKWLKDHLENLYSIPMFFREKDVDGASIGYSNITNTKEA